MPFFEKKYIFFTKGLKVYFGIGKNEMGKKKPGCYLLSRECSIIGVGGLNFRVRDGNGCDTSTMATKQE